MEKQKNTPTDLHLQYKNETGEYFQYGNYWTIEEYNYHSNNGFSWDYVKWLEEKYLNLLNKQQ